MYKNIVFTIGRLVNLTSGMKHAYFEDDVWKQLEPALRFIDAKRLLKDMSDAGAGGESDWDSADLRRRLSYWEEVSKKKTLINLERWKYKLDASHW